ncbi:hypothetical protein D9758_015266 [Tetrapyrgos nigripes]|uniref:TPR-like protein n=1 Tax=Tetrapyrgos nigripes TaxID=182062 RepID=A0A8H5FPE7_9AGAR|nr:hypothetical protein D9758_015266 [Tetrapyrgos nigripes]
MEQTNNGPDQTGTGNQMNILSGAHDFNIMGSTITTIGRNAHYTYKTYLPESKPKKITAESHFVEAVKLLCEANQVHIAILGTGGIGKTSVALHIMENALIKKKFSGRCYFIPCEILSDATTLTQGLVQAIGLQPIQGKGSYKLLLNYLKGCQESLLILDNFDTPWNSKDQAQVKKFIDKICSFKSALVIVNMRDTDGPRQTEWHKLGGQSGLPPLELVPAKQAFCSFTSNGKYQIDQRDPILEQLLRQMDGMPLAITLIAQQARKLPLKHLMEMWNSQKTEVLKKVGEQDDRLTSIEVSIELTLNLIREKLSMTGENHMRLVAFLPSGIPDWLENLPKMLPDATMQVLVLEKSCLIYEVENRTLKILTPIGEYIMQIFGRSEHLEDDIWRFYETFMDNLPEKSVARDSELRLHIANILKILQIKIEKSFETSHMNVLFQLHNYPQYFLRLVPLVEEYLRWQSQMSLSGQIEVMFLQEDMLSFMWKYERAIGIIDDVEKLNKHCENEETSNLEVITSSSISVSYTIKKAQAECYKRLGMISYYQNDYKESQWKIQQAMDLYEKGQYEEAKVMLEQAKEHFQGLGDVLGTARCLLHLGGISYMLSQYEDATVMLEQAQQQLEGLGDRLGAAQSLQHLGNISRMLGKYEQAGVMLEQAQQHMEELGHRLGAAQCLKNLGHISQMLGQYDQAKAMLQQAKVEFDGLGNSLGAAQCVQSLGNISQTLGQYEEAKVMLKQAKKVFEKAGYRPGAAQCLQCLGEISQILGQYEEANVMLQQAKDQFEGLRYRLGAAQCLLSLGNLSQMLCQYEKAQAMLEQAKEQFERLRFRLGVAQCLQRLGDISQMLGQYEAAKIILEQAKKQFEEIGYRLGVAQCLQYLGDIGYQKDCFIEARLNVEKAKECFDTMGMLTEVDDCLHSLQKFQEASQVEIPSHSIEIETLLETNQSLALEGQGDSTEVESQKSHGSC